MRLDPADDRALVKRMLGARKRPSRSSSRPTSPRSSTQEAQATVRGPGETDVFGDDLPLFYSFVP